MNKAFIDGLHAQVAQQVDKENEDAGQWTLGKLKYELEKLDGGKKIVFEHNERSPFQPHSYRGYYRLIAFDYTDDDITVNAFLDKVNEAIGNTYTGYKGGSFHMTERTFVYASEYGTSSGLRVVGIDESNSRVLIKTESEY